MPIALSDRITARIEEIDVSLVEVAYRVGVTEQAVRGWMSGGYRPRDEKLLPLAKALKWTLRDLLGTDG